jgi:hypothetical protein
VPHHPFISREGRVIVAILVLAVIVFLTVARDMNLFEAIGTVVVGLALCVGLTWVVDRFITSS